MDAGSWAILEIWARIPLPAAPYIQKALLYTGL
jgi:hypothetical protein